MSAIKDEAKKFGLPGTTHATGTEGIDLAADAGRYADGFGVLLDAGYTRRGDCLHCH